MDQPELLQTSAPGRPTLFGLGPLTVGLITISVVVGLLSRLGENDDVLGYLYITEYDLRPALPEVLHGQVWRLLTPIFIHFGTMHLVFNMLWLKDLGSMIERQMGTRLLFMLVVAIGALANLGQFFFDGPHFGGMSGVVYGLLGYIWMQSKFNPGSGLFVQQRTVWWMIGWFFLCVFGVIGNVANVAHAVGLGTGILWGYGAAKSRPSTMAG